MPEPYRSLLVHHTDMTPTLEKHHGAKIHLRLIGKRLEGDRLDRGVSLLLDGSEKPVEFGAIMIFLENFPADAREEILGCDVPLGTILGKYEIPRVSCPQYFLRVQSDEVMTDALALTEDGWLYGRRNLLATPDGKILAEILEILPP
jgi:chorismate-pyruvate lyase